MVQIDGGKQVYTKFRYNGRIRYVLHLTGGQVEYRHTNGEISTVGISRTGTETRRVCIANLLPDVSDGVLRMVMPRYREVRDIQAETWSSLYR
jgi:hypothetical protein